MGWLQAATASRVGIVWAARRANSASLCGVVVKLMVLGGSLALSAFLTAAALGTPDHPWVAWISLLPLFWVIRTLRPAPALVCGAVWGACLYAFAAGALPVIPPSARSLALLTAIPAAYACLGALASRTIGFNPLLLGLGWILVEVALRPLGLRHGLLAGTQGDGVIVDWLGRLLGYLFVAFLVVCVNASLLAVLNSARLSLPLQRSSAQRPSSGVCHLPRTSPCLQLWALRRGYPRAPPVPVRP